MKYQLKSLLITTVLVALVFFVAALTIRNNHLSKQLKDKSGGMLYSFAMTSVISSDQLQLTEKHKNEIQGLAYRLLRKPKYKSIFGKVVKQIDLKIYQSSGGNVTVLTEQPLGGVGSANDHLVDQYREELYAAIRRLLRGS